MASPLPPPYRASGRLPALFRDKIVKSIIDATYFRRQRARRHVPKVRKVHSAHSPPRSVPRQRLSFICRCIYRALNNIDEIEDALIVNLDLPGGGFFMPLFVKLKPAVTLDDRLAKNIQDELRRRYTPRHVPDKIIQVPDIPLTFTGKKMEVPVRKILLGQQTDKAANRSAMANPASLDFFVSYASEQNDYTLATKSNMAQFPK